MTWSQKFSQETGSGTNEQICGELTTISNGNSKKAPLPIDDDGGLNMLGYQIQPLRKCKHTDSANDNPQVELNVNNLLKCSVENCEFGTMEGDDLLKNDNHLTNMWICVTWLENILWSQLKCAWHQTCPRYRTFCSTRVMIYRVGAMELVTDVPVDVIITLIHLLLKN